MKGIFLKEFKRFNPDLCFFAFVAVFSAILFLIAGVGFLSVVLTAVFIYLYLRLCKFIWNIINNIFHREEVRHEVGK